jgi:hypothetical protein
MIARNLFQIGYLVVFTLAVMALGWGFWPAKISYHTITFPPDRLILLGERMSVVQEPYAMELEYTPVIRSGDQSQLRIIFQPLEMQERSQKLPEIEDVYVETRLELPGVQIEPAGTAGQIFLPGRAITFWWTIVPDRAGVYEGTVWLGLRDQSPDNDASQFTALAAPRVEVKVSRFLLLPGPVARWVGAFGLVLSAVAYFWRWRHA